MDKATLKYGLSCVAWPGLLMMCIAATAYGFAGPYPMMSFNAAYLFLILSLFFLERFMPHEEKWLEHDGQTFANIMHTLSSKATVQGLLVFGGFIGLTELITPLEEPGYSIWPREWPMFAQVILGMIVAEFGLYWAHRMAHEWPILWRFHAIHHSVTRLWIINTGRFHFIDSVISISLSVMILLALGAPMEVVRWQAAMTAFIGMLTHCNVQMRFGVLSYIFATPGVHRWHHSMKLSEGNRNYGENLMLWDQVFGTFINPKDRRPPVNIGIHEFMPPRFIHQLLWPFLTKHKKEEIEAQYADQSKTQATPAAAE